MSRIGRNPISIPQGVKLQIKADSISVEGPKGKLSYEPPKGISVEESGDKLLVKRQGETKRLKSFHGLARSLIANMIEGVSKGFKKELEIKGVGYKVQKKGSSLVLQLGFSHPVEVPVWQGLKVECPIPTKIVVEGYDKQVVGEYAAQIRRIMPPEPYKGKGIRYLGEEVRKKMGKSMTK